jgi:hypothetical protein
MGWPWQIPLVRVQASYWVREAPHRMTMIVSPFPGTVRSPVTQTPLARGRQAVYAGHILPGTARLQHKEDAVARATVVVPLPAPARCLLREEGFNKRPRRSRAAMSAHAHSCA